MSELKNFELGKSYIHSSGQRMKIVGMAETVIHGNALIGEDERGTLTPIQIDCDEFPEATIGWREASEKLKKVHISDVGIPFVGLSEDIAKKYTEDKLKVVNTLLSDDYKTGYKEGIEHFIKDKFQ
jgi:hypothetical protein